MNFLANPTPGRTLSAVVSAVVCLAWVLPASAGEGVYVHGDGTKVPLLISETEFGITYHDAEPTKVAPSAKRLASTGTGVVSDLPWAPGAAVKILNVADTTAMRRATVEADAQIQAVTPVYRFAADDLPMISTGTILVKLTAELPEADRLALWAEYGVAEEYKFDGLDRVYCVRPLDGPEDELRCNEALFDDDRTVWSHPNLIRPVDARQATGGVRDTYFRDQWHLTRIQAPEAWNIAAGLNVIVGMFDDSCDASHPDLSANYIGTGHDPTKQQQDTANYTDPRPEQLGDQHGTAVMGLAVASANDIGVRGVSYLSRFTASRGLSSGLSDSGIASTYTFARQQNVDVHINSWGTSRTNPPVIVSAIDTAFKEGRNLEAMGGPAGPRGMVIVFATGNSNAENTVDSDLSSLVQVIGIGASNINDERSSYSNFGSFINVLAPSGDNFLTMMTTTDNSDAAGYADSGYNVGGFDGFGFPDLDSAGNYTKTFSGTSAACPVAGGVAALILSVNPNLTATDVRLIMEHTCDQIDATTANYHGVTSRSFTHGYGRLNALKAVQAAQTTVTNGNVTWPERISNPRIVNNSILWEQNFGTSEFMIVESTQPFSFVPEDGVCYSTLQVGCQFSTSVQPLPAGVNFTFIGCSTGAEACATAVTHTVPFLLPAGKKYFGIYGRNAIGRYSYGVSIDSDGNKLDDGPVIQEPVSGGGGGVDGGAIDRVSVTIAATPKAGTSPLTVAFNGNAVSNIPIDHTQTAWDFDASDGVFVDTRERNATYTYTVLPGQTRRFTARLTMVDMEGNTGSAETQIFVDGGGTAPTPGGGTEGLRILVGTPGNPDANIESGTAPLNVELSLDATTITGQLQSVFWDLGDGTSARSLSVPHTYVNTTGSALRIAVSATVTTKTSANTTVSTVVSKLITVMPGPGGGGGSGNDNEDCIIPGSCPPDPVGGGSCGLFGMIMPLMGMGSLWLMKRRR